MPQTHEPPFILGPTMSGAALGFLYYLFPQPGSCCSETFAWLAPSYHSSLSLNYKSFLISQFKITSLGGKYRLHTSICFLKIIYLFIYLFMAALGLRCCTQAFSSCGELGLLFVVVAGFSWRWLPLVAEHGLSAHRLSSCGTWS